jgi:hypothetical protein
VLGRKRDDQFAIDRRQRAHRNDQAGIGLSGDSDGPFDLAGLAQADRGHLHPQRRRQRLDCTQLPTSTG